MPDRVKNLPGDLDASRRLKLNLSVLLQAAIREQVSQHPYAKAAAKSPISSNSRGGSRHQLVYCSPRALSALGVGRCPALSVASTCRRMMR